MGWTGTVGQSQADTVKRILAGDELCNEANILESHQSNTIGDRVIYQMIEHEGQTAVMVALVRGNMVKYMDETVGPVYHECPVEWLDRLTPTDELDAPQQMQKFAENWRRQVRAFHNEYEVTTAPNGAQVASKRPMGTSINQGQASLF